MCAVRGYSCDKWQEASPARGLVLDLVGRDLRGLIDEFNFFCVPTKIESANKFHSIHTGIITFFS